MVSAIERHTACIIPEDRMRQPKCFLNGRNAKKKKKKKKKNCPMLWEPQCKVGNREDSSNHILRKYRHRRQLTSHSEEIKTQKTAHSTVWGNTDTGDSSQHSLVKHRRQLTALSGETQTQETAHSTVWGNTGDSSQHCLGKPRRQLTALSVETQKTAHSTVWGTRHRRQLTAMSGETQTHKTAHSAV